MNTEEVIMIARVAVSSTKALKENRIDVESEGIKETSGAIKEAQRKKQVFVKLSFGWTFAIEMET